MHVFIDESSNFARPASGPGVSVVGMLMVPDARLPKIEQQYRRLRRGLPLENGEAKGKRLDEAAVARVTDLLLREDVLYFAAVIDLGLCSGADIDAYRRERIDGLKAFLNPEAEEQDRALTRWLLDTLERLAEPLYVQAVVMDQLIRRALETSINYYATRRPGELGRWRWVIDAKDPGGPTDWERWWHTNLRPMLHGSLKGAPFRRLPFGDFSYIDGLVGVVRVGPGGVADGHGIARLFEEVRFSPRPEPGLELVDILTNAMRRALTGRLGEEGWRGLPGLMVHTEDRHYVTLVNIMPDRQRLLDDEDVAWGPVIRSFRSGGRPLVPHHLLPRA